MVTHNIMHWRTAHASSTSLRPALEGLDHTLRNARQTAGIRRVSPEQLRQACRCVIPAAAEAHEFMERRLERAVIAAYGQAGYGLAWDGYDLDGLLAACRYLTTTHAA